MRLMRLLDALVYAAETHETFRQESGMRYQIRHLEPDPRSARALLLPLRVGSPYWRREPLLEPLSRPLRSVAAPSRRPRIASRRAITAVCSVGRAWLYRSSVIATSCVPSRAERPRGS